MHLYKVFLQKINVKPSLQKPNYVGALQRIIFILTLKLNPNTYMKLYWLVSFTVMLSLPFNHMIKEINFVKDHYWNVHQNIHSPTVEARAALQNSIYSEGSTCLTLNTVTLSLFTSSVLQTSQNALSAEITARLKL